MIRSAGGGGWFSRSIRSGSVNTVIEFSPFLFLYFSGAIVDSCYALRTGLRILRCTSCENNILIDEKWNHNVDLPVFSSQSSFPLPDFVVTTIFSATPHENHHHVFDIVVMLIVDHVCHRLKHVIFHDKCKQFHGKITLEKITQHNIVCEVYFILKIIFNLLKKSKNDWSLHNIIEHTGNYYTNNSNFTYSLNMFITWYVWKQIFFFFNTFYVRIFS